MNILYLAPIAYEDLRQRPQYIAERLAEKHTVVYVEPTVRAVSCVLGRAKGYKGQVRIISKNLTIVRCNGTFVAPFRWRPYDILNIGSMAEKIQLKKYVDTADIIMVGYEGWTDIIWKCKNTKIIYDKMDDNVLLTPEISIKRYLQKAETKLLRKITCMVVTAQKFAKVYQDRVKHIYLIPNGIDIDIKSKNEKKKSDEKNKVFGYIGMISEWFDMEALKVIAEQKNISVDMVGPCNIEKYDKQNVFYEGCIPKDEVGNKIQEFDVCLYPFKKGELLDTINPVKIYEYLAENKPVIAVDSLETRRFGTLVYRYHNYKELKQLCNMELKKPFETETECMNYIEKNSWEERTKQFEKILEEL